MSEQLMIGIVLGGLALVILLILAFRFGRNVMPKSLNNRLSLAFAAVASFSVILMVAVVLLQIRATLLTQSGESLVALAESNRDRLAEQLSNEITGLENLASNYNIVNPVSFGRFLLDQASPEERTAELEARKKQWTDPDTEISFLIATNATSAALKQLAQNLSQFEQIIVTDAQGELAGFIGEPPENYFHGYRFWWQEAWQDGQGGFYVGPPRLKDDGTIIVEIALPLQPSTDVARSSAEKKKGLQGVLRARLRLNDLALFSSALSSPDPAELALMDNSTGKWLFSSTQKDKIGSRVPGLVQDNINQNDVSWGVDPDETGENIIHSHAKLRSSEAQPYPGQFDFTIIVQQQASIALQGLYDFIEPVAVGGLIALALASLVGFVIGRQISRPVSDLTAVVVEMADGQLDRSAPIKGAAELRTLAESFNRMTDQLRRILAGLEAQVAARTERLEIVATLGEHLNAILNLDDLLAEVVNQIQAHFGYYHAHIYLLDDERHDLVVAAGTGPAGADMKVAGHSIALDAETSLVARAARTETIVRADNVRETEGWLPNPLLPDTYSEMAVPIMLEDQVVGVLDVQENRIAGLDEGDAALLRSLANQVAVAIRNARLFEEVETALAEAHEAQRLFIEQAWDKDRVVQQGSRRVQFSLGESTTLDETALAIARQKAQIQHEPAVILINGSDESTDDAGDGENVSAQRALVAPITLGDITIGNLQMHGIDPQRKWSDDDLALIGAVIDQVAQTAENLRLLGETQERATREQLISRISDKLRRAPDLETLMKVATSEISRVLDPARTFVNFDTKTILSTSENGEMSEAVEASEPSEEPEPSPEPEASIETEGAFEPEESSQLEDDYVEAGVENRSSPETLRNDEYDEN